MRLSQLKDVLFPVEEHPVFVAVPNESGERRIVAPGKKAIVNLASQRVLGVVSRDYRLVTNQEALDWAYECCRCVFPDTNPAEWEVSATDGPSTGGYCRIDLVHRTAALDFGDVRATVRINGEVKATPLGREAIDNQLRTVAWLANALHRYGRRLQAGQRIMTGSFTKPLPVSPGDSFETEFSAIGTVSASFE